MPSHTPKIDPRTFDELVKEVLQLAPSYSRTWARPQRHDPGHALGEVFSATMEMLLERLNRLPEKVFAELLNLIGMRLRLPVPATALARFQLAPEREAGTWVPGGTRVGTLSGDDGEPIVFETERDVFVFETGLAATLCRHRARWAAYDAGDAAGFQPFADLEPVVDSLEIDDPRLAELAGRNDLTVRFECPQTKGGDVRDFLRWELSLPDGTWQELPGSSLDDPARPDAKQVVFHGPVEGLETSGVSGGRPPRLRGMVHGRSAHPEAVQIAKLGLSIGANARGVRPTQALTSLGDGFFAVLDQASHFTPFSPAPKTGTAMYFLAEAAVSTPDSRIELDVTLADSPSVKTPRPSLDLILQYEYFNGSDWISLGATTPFGAKGTYLPHLFTDATRAMSRSGKVAFNRPADIRSLNVRGIDGNWLRVRIAQGDYGERGNHERPLRPPVLRRIRVRQQQVSSPAAAVSFVADFVREEWTERLREGTSPLTLLRRRPASPPCLLFGFAPKPAAKPLALWFELEDSYRTELAAQNGAVQERLVWEYHNGRDWSPLFPRDNTDRLRRSGSVEFTVPSDIEEGDQCGQRAAWVRARFSGLGVGAPALPRVLALHINAVEIVHRRTERKVSIGQGDGTPHQLLRFPKTPVLERPELWVKEAEEPAPDQARSILRESGERAIRVEADGSWVRWREVKTFADSGPTSRHFTLDHLEGRVRFGDGQRGLCPANGDEVVAEYHLGGGLEGNVERFQVIDMHDAVPYVEEVTNPWPGLGGLPLGSLEEVMRSGPQLIKNRQRAVTAEDYAWLVREKFGEVARVRCFDDPSQEGRVTVTVIPAPPVDDLAQRLLPSSQLVQAIHQHLVARCQIGLQVVIAAAELVDVDVTLVLALKVSGARVERVKRDIETRVRRHLHPTRGGPHGQGWPFGRDVLPSDVLKSLEPVVEIDYLSDLRLRVDGRRVGKVVLGPRELLHIARFEIIELMGR